MVKKIPFAQNKHKTDVVAYLTLVGWLIAYFCGNRAASRFHLNQALSILLADLGLNAVFMMATFADTAVASVLVRGVCGLLSNKHRILISWRNPVPTCHIPDELPANTESPRSSGNP